MSSESPQMTREAKFQAAFREKNAMTVREAIKDLRSVMGISQETLARKLNVTLRTVARYEKDAMPQAGVLAALRDMARVHGRNDLVETFELTRVVLYEKVGFDIHSAGAASTSGLVVMAATNRALTDAKYLGVRERLIKVLKPVLDDLAYGVPLDDLVPEKGNATK